MKVIKFQSSNQKQTKKRTNEQSSKSKHEVLIDFRSKLNENLGLSLKDWDDYEFTKQVCIIHKNKLFSNQQDTYQLNYQNKDFRLSLIPLTSNKIEIWWIEVYNQGKGLGTDLMNSILDVSDLTGIGVKVIPIDFKSEDGDVDSLLRLRNWYKSFGYKSKNFNRTPELFYEPQEIELKQVS